MAAAKVKRKLWISALVLALVAAAVAVKLIFFPSVKDAWFALNKRNLLRVPPGVVVVRPTHFFVNSVRKGVIYATSHDHGARVERIMGRNVPLRLVFAVAYDANRAQVALPPDAPKGNFDFLVTVATNQRPRLQAALRRKLDYVAQKEMRNTDVLAIKVVNGALPGLKISRANGRPSAHFRNGKVYFTHVRLGELTGNFERWLDTPVVDKTGLTNSYDFSTVFDGQTQERLSLKATRRATIEKMLNGWGLALKPDTAFIKMLVVKRED